MTPPAAALVAQTVARNSDPTAVLWGAGASGNPRAKRAAQDFEAVFLNQMFQHMFTGIDGEGPFGGGVGGSIWRSFLTEQYSKTFSKAGGIGFARPVYPFPLPPPRAPPPPPPP